MLILIRLFSIMAVIFVTGCATNNNFTSTPIYESDFNKPLAEIRDSFSDVALFEKEWEFNSTLITGKLSTLEDKWGKAEKVQKQWTAKIHGTLVNAAIGIFLGWPVFVITETVFLFPLESHQWIKGDTVISATVHRFAPNGYERRIGYWEWSKVTKNVPADTKPPDTSKD